MNAQHSAETCEHGSPPAFVNLAHDVMGGIDIDPASSSTWNVNVRALRIISEAENGLRTPWFAGAPAPLELRTNPMRPLKPSISAGVELAPRRRGFVNPPGDRRGALVAAFWFATAEYFHLGWLTSAVWVGFSVEQLSRLQRVGARSHPLQHITLIPSRRIDYIDGQTGKVQEDATHASFVTLLTRSRREIQTFAALASQYGHVVNGDRA